MAAAAVHAFVLLVGDVKNESGAEGSGLAGREAMDRELVTGTLVVSLRSGDLT